MRPQHFKRTMPECSRAHAFGGEMSGLLQNQAAGTRGSQRGTASGHEDMPDPLQPCDKALDVRSIAAEIRLGGGSGLLQLFACLLEVSPAQHSAQPFQCYERCDVGLA